MAVRIVNVGDMEPDPVEVRFSNGETYKLPGDIPAPLYLKMQEAAAQIAKDAEEGKDTPDVIVGLHEELLSLFHVHHPDLKVLPVGITTMTRIIPEVYYPNAEREAQQNGVPPTPPTRGGSTPSRRRKSRS